MTCNILSDHTHRAARAEAMRAEWLATSAEMDGAQHLGDWARYDRLRAESRRQYDAYWREHDAAERARIEATYPECEE